MLLRTKSEHEIASSEITPRETYRAYQQTRRSLLAGMGAVAATAVLAAPGECGDQAECQAFRYTVPDRDTTPEAKAQSYNNFYEFGEDKSDPAHNASKMHIRPWTVKVEGLVSKPQVLNIDDLLAYGRWSSASTGFGAWRRGRW
jgi:sulfoxide reductase catalytic subunit YedY